MDECASSGFKSKLSTAVWCVLLSKVKQFPRAARPPARAGRFVTVHTSDVASHVVARTHLTFPRSPASHQWHTGESDAIARGAPSVHYYRASFTFAVLSFGSVDKWGCERFYLGAFY